MNPLLFPAEVTTRDLDGWLYEGHTLTLREKLLISRLAEKKNARDARVLSERRQAIAAAFYLMEKEQPGISRNICGQRLAAALNRYLASAAWRQERHQEHIHGECVDGMRRLIHRIALLTDGKSLKGDTLRKEGAIPLRPNPKGA